jgi:predicted phage tail protein
LSYQLTGLQAGTGYNITVQAANASGNGPASAALAITTASATATAPQVVSLTATATSTTAMQLTWALPAGASAVLSYTVQYRVTGTSGWTWSATGITGLTTTISGLQTATSYDFTVYSLNASGNGPVSSTVSAATSAGPHAVSSITWNLLPSGTYTHGSGAIGVNANVSPATAAVQFGFSQSATVPPTSWTSAAPINSSLWGAYVPTPTTAGTWYSWAEGTDGSSPTVSSTTFLVQ